MDVERRMKGKEAVAIFRENGDVLFVIRKHDGIVVNGKWVSVWSECEIEIRHQTISTDDYFHLLAQLEKVYHEAREMDEKYPVGVSTKEG